MTVSRPHIVWFRDDLRLADNPALFHAARSGAPVLALYLLEPEDALRRQPGAAALWWLHGSLESLGRDLASRGVPLSLLRGSAHATLPALAHSVGACAVSWNRRPGACSREKDEILAAPLKDEGVDARHFPANMLFEPGSVRTGSGGPYRVFTPFWRAARQMTPESPLPVPEEIMGWRGAFESDNLDDWALRPTRPNWASGLAQAWTPGEANARRRLDAFMEGAIRDYGAGRDFPASAATSLLSPSLRFGEISVREIWYRVGAAMHAKEAPEADAEKFLSEVGWREFCHHLLCDHPDLATRNFNSAFDHFDWASDSRGLEAWQKGQTGYPIVDAGMRELWATGWMHNRVRMITASFLTKHLLIDWREGERWFWDTLVDADPANNPAGWQWVAGCGADAAPYFRIFNPVLQGEKFDPDGAYVRHWVPELERLDKRWLHKPWEAPARMLAEAQIRLGETYPQPVVDHGAARKRALATYETMKRDAP
ncbi:deoxyribodipyrimidine photo-lyase [Breoghania sp.]|uniref:cryptochrome/photolyase family protein n=1 Tax=Breoghania sp. TaxID=2065378 RepID=UPI002AABB079|nr:deoxyribodipyrimidine photo-lyase [Breoghania sp.]